MHGVRFAYQMRPDKDVLKEVSLHIPAGSVCAFVGKSGGGKSTLIHLLMRFYDPKAGRITMDGASMTSLNMRCLHRWVGLVAQDTQLFAESVTKNITYGLEDSEWTMDDVIAAATEANAHEFISEFDEGYATRVGERGVRLSGGQKQRIAIARVLLRRPKLLFLDEATSALDSESEALVQEALDRVIGSGGCTIVLVAHRLSTVMSADQIAVVGDGAILERGTHAQLLALDGKYAKLVSRQLHRDSNVIPEGAGQGAGQGAGAGLGRAATVDELMDDESPSSSPPPDSQDAQDAATRTSMSALLVRSSRAGVASPRPQPARFVPTPVAASASAGHGLGGRGGGGGGGGSAPAPWRSLLARAGVTEAHVKHT